MTVNGLTILPRHCTMVATLYAANVKMGPMWTTAYMLPMEVTVLNLMLAGF